jgi:hypothetical protein
MGSRIVYAALLACAALGLDLGPTACGGRILVVAVDGGANDDASASGPGGDDASSGQDFGVCPAVPPTVGTSCTPPGNGCAYFDQNGATTTSCQAFLCDASGHWQASTAGC